jgi:hypothetical protein
MRLRRLIDGYCSIHIEINAHEEKPQIQYMLYISYESTIRYFSNAKKLNDALNERIRYEIARKEGRTLPDIKGEVP